MGKSRAGLVLLVAIMVAGCTSTFKGDVSSWHQMPPASGERYVIVPKDAGKEGSIEFAHYAEIVSQNLQRVGYRPAASTDKAELVVRIDYGVSDGRTEVRSYGSGFGYHGYYGYRPYYYGGWGYGYGRGYSDVRSYAVYARRLEMEIAAPGAEKNLYESTVVSEGRSNRLQESMPYMVQAMFTDWPGPSGQTRRVKLNLDDPTDAAKLSQY